MTAPADHDEDLCVCGHERRKHSVAVNEWTDIGCTHMIVPVSKAIGPFECHCHRYRRAADRI